MSAETPTKLSVKSQAMNELSPLSVPPPSRPDFHVVKWRGGHSTPARIHAAARLAARASNKAYTLVDSLNVALASSRLNKRGRHGCYHPNHHLPFGDKQPKGKRASLLFKKKPKPDRTRCPTQVPRPRKSSPSAPKPSLFKPRAIPIRERRRRAVGSLYMAIGDTSERNSMIVAVPFRHYGILIAARTIAKKDLPGT